MTTASPSRKVPARANASKYKVRSERTKRALWTEEDEEAWDKRRRSILWQGMCRSQKPHIINTARSYKDMVDWSIIVQNPANWAYELAKESLDMLNWSDLSASSVEWAGRLLNDNIDKVDWQKLARNRAPWARELAKEIVRRFYHD